jgi:hypothetical protein
VNDDVDGGHLACVLGAFRGDEIWEFHDASREVDARAVYRHPLMFVLKGSRLSPYLDESARDKVSVFREWLTTEKIVIRNVFQKHYPFTSPSEAACVLAGASKNGFLVWERQFKTMQEWGFKSRPSVQVPPEFLGRRPVP